MSKRTDDNSSILKKQGSSVLGEEATQNSRDYGNSLSPLQRPTRKSRDPMRDPLPSKLLESALDEDSPISKYLAPLVYPRNSGSTAQSIIQSAQRELLTAEMTSSKTQEYLQAKRLNRELKDMILDLGAIPKNTKSTVKVEVELKQPLPPVSSEYSGYQPSTRYLPISLISSISILGKPKEIIPEKKIMTADFTCNAGDVSENTTRLILSGSTDSLVGFLGLAELKDLLKECLQVIGAMASGSDGASDNIFLKSYLARTKGEALITDGIYRGDLLRGVPCGVGEATFSNGDTYEGSWAKGTFEGKGKYNWKDSKSPHFRSTYEGQYRGGLFQGAGMYTHPDGGVFTGSFNQDVKQGPYVYQFPDGKMMYGMYREGEEEGKYIWVGSDGQSVKVGKKRSGLKQGEVNVYTISKVESWEKGKLTTERSVIPVSDTQSQRRIESPESPASPVSPQHHHHHHHVRRWH